MKAKIHFLLLAALSAFLALPSLAAPAPRLACDEPVFDFGDVSADAQSTVDHDYLIRNDGDLSLEILSVRASCGCTAVNASQNIVAPGATATIHASFNLANRSGAQVKTITVTSNDPERPTTLLTLRGNIVKPLTANPAALYYGRVSSPSFATREVVLTASQPFAVTSASTASPHLSATPDSSTPSTSHTLAVAILPSMPAGPFGDTLTVLTDLPVAPKILIPLTGFWTPSPADPDPEPQSP